MIEKIKKEVEVISAVYDIFDKIRAENNIIRVVDPLKSIISGEIRFALEQLDHSSTPNEMGELKRQVVMNSYIFKENFKVICGIIGELRSGVDLEGDGQVGEFGKHHQESAAEVRVWSV